MDIYQNPQRCYTGDCVAFITAWNPKEADCILLTRPISLRYRSRDGRTVTSTTTIARWLRMAFTQMYRLLKNGSFLRASMAGTTPTCLFPRGAPPGFAS